jgi:hypothetical protein
MTVEEAVEMKEALKKNKGLLKKGKGKGKGKHWPKKGKGKGKAKGKGNKVVLTPRGTTTR